MVCKYVVIKVNDKDNQTNALFGLQENHMVVIHEYKTQIPNTHKTEYISYTSTGELGYDGPLYDGFFHMTDKMLGPSPMRIKYSSYVS